MSIAILSPNGDLVSTDLTLEQLTTDAQADGRTVEVLSPQIVSTPVTWPTDRDIVFRRGGYVTFSGSGSLTGIALPSPEHFGAAGDGITDDSVAFQSALDAAPTAGGYIFLTASTYKISAITINKPITLIGLGRAATIIKSADATSNTITLDVANCKIQGVGFTSAVTRTAGSYIHITKNCSSSEISDFYMTGGFRGITGVCINTIWINNGVIASTASGGDGIALIGDGVTAAGNDIYINKITMTAPTNIARSGIYISNHGAVNITDCDIIRHGKCLFINPGNGEQVCWIYVLNTYFDTSTFGMTIEPQTGGLAQGIRANGCWFSAHDQYGIYVGSAGTMSGMELISPHIFSNTSGGILLDGGSEFHIIGGGIGALTDGVSTGITVVAGVSGFHFLGVKIGNGYLKNRFAYGIWIAPGASDNYSIIGCDLAGNATPFSDNSTSGTVKQIMGNIGVNPGPTQGIVVGDSPFTHTAGSVPETVYINGGTVTLITVDGVPIFDSTGRTIRLGPFKSVIVAYSAVPGMYKTLD